MAQADSNAELISAYLDEQLGPDELQAFESLLDADPGVQRELAEMRQMLRMVADLPEVTAPPDFYEKLAKKTRSRVLDPQGLLLGLISLPFQVLSILVILVIAATLLMLELDRDTHGQALEPDPSARSQPSDEPPPASQGPNSRTDLRP